MRSRAKSIACVWLAASGVLVASDSPPTRAGWVWPTPNPAQAEGRPYADFVQPTDSGLVESGLFGCVRSNGRQFHEGLDLLALRRDKRGEPADSVYAVTDGVVRYANSNAGLSSYGRYVVIEHAGMRPAISTLYAHLASVAPGVESGARVEAGTTLGLMGRSAAGYSIPKQRGHLHIEAGLWLSHSFQSWYDRQGFPNKNDHRTYNGQNFVGFDFLDFIENWTSGRVSGVEDYLIRQPTALTIVVRESAVPDFVRRYPQFAPGTDALAQVPAWRIEMTWYGLPKAWSPVSAGELAAITPGRVVIIHHDAGLLERFPCQRVVRVRKGRVETGSRAADIIDILFATPAP